MPRFREEPTKTRKACGISVSEGRKHEEIKARGIHGGNIFICHNRNNTSKKLAWYYAYVESAKRYENLLGWNIVPMSEYNAVVKMPCGQFSTYTDREHFLGAYGKNTYGTYNMHSSVIRTENMNISEGKKFLLIRDSFSGCVVPFVALGVKHVDAVDLRTFSGSIRSYIASEKPDAVAVMYYAEMPGRTGAPYSSDTDRRLYDFR